MPSGDFYQVDFDRKSIDRVSWEKLNFALRRIYEQFSKLKGDLVEGTVTTTTGTTYTIVTTSVAINTTAPLQGGGDLSSDRTLSITQSTSTTDGYLSATDWVTFNAKVPPTRLVSTTAPLTGGGALSSDLTLGITQATSGTDGYLSAVDWVTFNSKMNNPMTTLGDIIYGGASGTPTRLAAGASSTALLGGSTPSWGAVTETHISLSDITTNDTSVSKHGFAPKLSGSAAEYLNGEGNWATPAASAVTAYSSTSFTSQTSVNVVHNFGAYPAVQVIDDSDEVVIPQSITHNTVNDFTVTFSASTTGTIIATIGSPGFQSVIAVSNDYAILATDRIVKVTASGKTITLPTAVGRTGQEYVIDNASTGDVYLEATGVETIEGETTQTLPTDSAIHVYSDGSNWRIY